MVCAGNCAGYELFRSLDFDDADSYASGIVNTVLITGTGWLPIGTRTHGFNTTFDGNEHTISNLYIDRTGMLNNPGAVGLFGAVGQSGVVREIGLVDVMLTGVGYAGGLVGDNSGTVSGSHATGAVTVSRDYVGGLAGVNRDSGSISDSQATGTVTGFGYVGGVAGYNRGSISGSHATGDVTGTSYHDGVGGLAGDNSGSITDSHATGAVTGSARVGGLAGVNRDSGSISGSHATGTVTGRDHVGGLAGSILGRESGFGVIRSKGSISNSHATGNVTGSDHVGGLAGSNLGNISDSHATGNVTGSNDVGGLAGSSGSITEGLFGGYIGVRGTISDCAAAGIVSGVSKVGGLIGYNHYGNITDSHATGNVTGNGQVGGLVGSGVSSISRRDGGSSISGSYAAGNVTGGGGDYVGGLAGSSYTISGSHAAGNVTGGGGSFVGGLAGSSSTISGSYATGSVAGGGGDYVGGLAGSSYTISGSHATGSVAGGDNVGGLAGSNGGTISASYATGIVSGGSGVGGLAGSNDETISASRRGSIISASYATGIVSGGSDVGGLAGSNGGAINASYANGTVSGGSDVGGLAGNNSGTISATYAVGKVSGNENVGGLIGSDSGDVIAGFWDNQTSGQGTGVGDGDPIGVVGKTTVELQGPTGYTGIYIAWMIDLDNADGDLDLQTGVDEFWDFGTSSQYPALIVDFDGDGTPTWQEFGSQRGAPTGLTATANGQTQIDLSWRAPTDTGGSPVTGYKIESSANGNEPWTEVETTGNADTNYSDTGLTAGTTRYYRVSAVTSAGTGAPSNMARATTLTALVNPPGAPTGLTATSNGTTQIDLSWSAPSSDGGAAITGYRIEVSADGSTWSDLEADTGSTSTSYSHTGLTAGTTRHYRVSAINSAGTGAESNVASAITTLGDSLIDRYDTNNNGMIEKNEVIKAINDYLFGAGDEAISKTEVIRLINLYLFG